jgi:exopolysaccharide biosynthesis polyprenyl glycosylphosphotransferase
MGGQPTATVVVQDGLRTNPLPGCDFVDVEALGLWPDLNAPASIDALSRIIAPYDRVVISCHFERRPAWATFLKSQDVGGEILLDRDLLHGAVAIGAYGNDDTLILSRGPLSLTSRLQKRAFDMVVSLAALLVFAPLMLVVAILIKLESRGPVFFQQTRVGVGNRQFQILKFRSMRVESSDSDGNVSTQRDDPRITRVGNFIRRTSIDELPQLFNVLRGDMSIVGPRPHALGSLAGDNLFWEVTQTYWIRHALKPGITGLAQIRGFRGATDSAEALEDRVRADLEYVSNWSLSQDMVILLRTARVLVHKNAY